MLTAEERETFWNLKTIGERSVLLGNDTNIPLDIQQAVDKLLKDLEAQYPNRAIRMLILSTVGRRCETAATELAKAIMHEESGWAEDSDGGPIGDRTLEGIAFCARRSIQTVKKWNTEIVKNAYWAYQERKSAHTEAAAREAHGYAEG